MHYAAENSHTKIWYKRCLVLQVHSKLVLFVLTGFQVKHNQRYLALHSSFQWQLDSMGFGSVCQSVQLPKGHKSRQMTQKMAERWAKLPKGNKRWQKIMYDSKSHAG